MPANGKVNLYVSGVQWGPESVLPLLPLIDCPKGCSVCCTMPEPIVVHEEDIERIGKAVHNNRLKHQLKRLERNLDVRERLWHLYDEGLAGVEGVRTPRLPASPGTRHARHLYTIQLDLEKLSVDRAQFMKALSAENIGTGIHFVPVHLHRFYQNTYGYRRGDFPEAERIGDRTVSLPLSASMDEDDALDVVTAVRKVALHYLRRETVASIAIEAETVMPDARV